MLKNRKLINLLLVLAPVLCVLVSLFIGRYPLSFSDIMNVISGRLFGSAENLPHVHSTLVFDIRMPRAILGCLVGASLAVSGTALQGLFRNPLVSSGMLGVSSGAGFGAALAIVLFQSTAMIYVSAFFFALSAVLFSYMIGRIYNTAPAIMLVLGGVIISSIFSALLSFIKYIADPYEELPSIVFWLMGSLASADYSDILVAAIPMITGITGLVFLRWKINVLAMGEKEARSLGINTTSGRILVIVFATLATAGAVCVSGIIGWIGLVIPHIGRLIAGNDNRILIPASISLGACFLILVDNTGRIISSGELPLSILTAIAGGPFFIYILKKTRGGNW